MSEAAMMRAIGEHMTESMGEPHVVSQYVIIADCLDAEGEELLLWVSSNPKWISDYKMVGWVFEQIKHRMKRQWDNIFDENEDD